MPHKKINLILVSISALHFICLLYFINHLFQYKDGYLPSPFFINKSDSLMDLFNPMSWVDNPGRYTEYQSVYPPINFLLLGILKILSGASTYEHSAYHIRANSIIPQIIIFTFYLGLPALILSMRYYCSFRVTTRVLVYIIFLTGIPALYALDRGNLILLALPLVAASLSNVPKARIVGVAFLINLKPYFIILSFLILIKNYKIEASIVILLTLFIFLSSGLVVDANNFLLIFFNLLNFDNSSLTGNLDLSDLRSNIFGFSKANIATFLNLIGIQDKESGVFMILIILKYLTISYTLLILIIKKNFLTIQQSYCILYVLLLNISGSIGGYSLVIYFCLLPIFNSLRFSTTYYVLIVIINAPIDLLYNFGAFVIDYNFQPEFSYSYLSGTSISQIRGSIGVGNITRPIFNAVIMTLLLIEATASKFTAKYGDYVSKT